MPLHTMLRRKTGQKRTLVREGLSRSVLWLEGFPARTGIKECGASLLIRLRLLPSHGKPEATVDNTVITHDPITPAMAIFAS
jgi:hypothetical protein